MGILLVELHSTRLVPIDYAGNYLISGIASKCDWVLSSCPSDVDEIKPQHPDYEIINYDQNHTYILLKNNVQKPKTVFVSLRKGQQVLNYVKKLIDSLDSSVILITGSEDTTLPNSYWTGIDGLDLHLNHNIKSVVGYIANHPQVNAWFVENLDSKEYDKMIPLPLGMYPVPSLMCHSPEFLHRFYPNFSVEEFYNLMLNTPNTINESSLENKETLVLCLQRVHESIPGYQQHIRYITAEYAKTHWKKFCKYTYANLQWGFMNPDNPDTFRNQIAKSKFLICTRGGGIDPSPKAWEALYMGTIPIVERSALDEAYSQLPVFYVDEWTPDCLDPDVLEDFWQKNKHRLIDENYKLFLDYWWDWILNY